MDILKRLYEEQVAVVDVGVQSRTFCLKRGVKQGDPISGLLFLAVVEVCFRKLREKWRSLNARRTGQYYGFVLESAGDPLTNLRFADDVLLIAQSRADARKMTEHLATEAAKFGLKINADKTKILTTAAQTRASSVEVGSQRIDIISPENSERYLGRMLCLADYHTAELRNRLKNAWAAFSKYRTVFHSTAYPFLAKAKLFEHCVTPVALYGSACWTLTKDMEHLLASTRRRMLRSMLCKHRRPDEDWIDFVRRATKESEASAQSGGARDWVILCSERKRSFAGKTARCNIGKWSTRLLNWKPWFRTVPFRLVGRPHTRWDGCFEKLAGGNWTEHAQDEGTWMALASHFCSEYI